MKYQKAILSITTVASLFLSVTYALAADLTSGACSSLSSADRANNPVCSTPSTTANPTIHVIHVTADLFGLFTGVLAVIMIIVSGITMITSSGNAEAVGKARKRLINSVVGLLIVAFAWTIVIFLTDRLIK